MSRNCWKRRARRGLTLVEVVAGLALLATLLVSILMAYGLHSGQIRAAQDRLEAIHLADELLNSWTATGSMPAVGEQERLNGDRQDLWWRIVDGSTSGRPQNGLRTVRLEVVRRAFGTPDTVVTSVELFVMDTAQEALL